MRKLYLEIPALTDGALRQLISLVLMTNLGNDLKAYSADDAAEQQRIEMIGYDGYRV